MPHRSRGSSPGRSNGARSRSDAWPRALPMSRRVAVAGVALSETGRVDDKTPYALAAQASRPRARRRGSPPARRRRPGLDGTRHARTRRRRRVPRAAAALARLHRRGRRAWEIMAAHATDAIAEGHADVILLTYGSTARSDLKTGLAIGEPRAGARAARAVRGPRSAHTLISKYAMAARRHMHEYGTHDSSSSPRSRSRPGTTRAQPRRLLPGPITVDDVLELPDDRRPAHEAALLHPHDGGGAAAVLVGRGPARRPA